jgi:formate dehydrogenase subunit gamma
MTTSVSSLEGGAASNAQAVPEGELLRHPASTRFIHWMVAMFFILALLSGLGIYTPWLYHWLTPIFGGGPTTRLLHPWFSIFFVFFFALEFVNWRRLMAWTQSDSAWMKRMKAYVSNTEKHESADVGFFNGGQKLFFWMIVLSSLTFLVSGIPMWFPEVFGGVFVSIGYVLHDVAALLMLGGFIVHIYEGTVSQPGTFQSMTRGTVSDAWAWTFHPAWYKEYKNRRR